MQHWFTYPNIDPIAFRLGPISVHWYGLSYLFAFICVYLWLNRPAGRARLGLTSDQIQDFLVNSLIGVLVGGRTFFVFADILSHHNPDFYFLHPLNIIAVWNGGMGFFGGLIGVIIAMLLFARKHPQLTFQALADEVVMVLPIGPLYHSDRKLHQQRTGRQPMRSRPSVVHAISELCRLSLPLAAAGGCP